MTRVVKIEKSGGPEVLEIKNLAPILKLRSVWRVLRQKKLK